MMIIVITYVAVICLIASEWCLQTKKSTPTPVACTPSNGYYSIYS